MRQRDPWINPESWAVERFGLDGFNLIRGRLHAAEAHRLALRRDMGLRALVGGRYAGAPSLRLAGKLAEAIERDLKASLLGSETARYVYADEEAGIASEVLDLTARLQALRNRSKGITERPRLRCDPDRGALEESPAPE